MQKQYILKVLPANLISYNNFQWPSEIGAVVTAPDWKRTKECGNGLHGWLNGQGDYNVCNYFESTTKWLVLSTTTKIINLDGKVKFKTCVIEFIGDQKGASDFLAANSTEFSGPVIGKFITSTSKLEAIGGYRSILSGGDYSTLTGGHSSKLTGGDFSKLTGDSYSTLIGGVRSTLTGGDYSKLTGGNQSTLNGGNHSKLTGGHYSKLTGGVGATLTCGDCSKLTGDDGSTLNGGNHSKLTGGHYSKLTGGDGSEFRCEYYDGSRYRTAVCVVGEKGIEPNVAYKVNNNGEFIKN